METTPAEVLVDTMANEPDQVITIYLKDEDLYIDSDMSYMEILGALEIAKDETKRRLMGEAD